MGSIREESHRRALLYVCAVNALLLLTLTLSASVAAAAPKPIVGKLSKRGYTVIALAKSGEATTKRAPKGKFRLRPPVKKVTLHLRAPDGAYAGPIVLAKKRKGKRAILGLKAKKKVKLGNVKVRGKKGYAKLSERAETKLAKRGQLDRRREAKAKKGVPIGAGRFGFVRVKKTKGGVPGDSDRDGVADPLDIDANGNLVLDKYERSTAARSAAEDEVVFSLTSEMLATLRETANANAAALTQADIESALSTLGFLWLQNNRDNDGIAIEVDCGGLSYCSSGGTGRATTPSAAGGPPRSWSYVFPDCCDGDGDGFGELNRVVPEPPVPDFPWRNVFLSHGATTDQIGTGDVIMHRVVRDGVEDDVQFPRTIEDVFATVPALVSYDDGAGNSATVSYPVPAPYTGSPPDWWANPCIPLPVPNQPYCTYPPPQPAGYEGFPVASSCGADSPAPCVNAGDVVLTLTFWRPQRKAIVGEDGQWTDIGGLVYSAQPDPGLYTPTPPFPCQQSDYSTTDPNLEPAPGEGAWGGAGFRDLAADRPADPDNTLTFSVNVTQCLSRPTPEPPPGTQPPYPWNVGGNLSIQLAGAIGAAVTGNQEAAWTIQQLYFKRVG